MIRFTSPAAPSVSMFDKDALALIKMMGHSGSVPSAIRAEDVPAALQKLETALAALQAEQETTNAGQQTANDCPDKPISANVRAYPLLELLRAAITQQKGIMWEQDTGFF